MYKKVQCVKFSVVLFEMWGTEWPTFQFDDYSMTVKEKLSLYRPGEALGASGDSGSQDF
jgi:hypothetical protein